MSNKANQESICTNGTRNTLQSPQGAENRAGTQTLVDTSAEQKARDLYIQAESCHDRAVPPAEQQAAPKAAPAPLSESIDQLERELAIIGVAGAIDGYDVVRRESVLEIARRAAIAAQGGKV